MQFSREVQRVLEGNLTKIILYGSYARGDFTENSDIDIMILTKSTDREIEEIENAVFDLAFDYQLKYCVDISVVIKNEGQFNYWLGVLPFYDHVNQEGIVLNG